ncbi:MAG: hypothetical protein ABIH20_00310 [Candidatus Diapherotrites archaeon]
MILIIFLTIIISGCIEKSVTPDGCGVEDAYEYCSQFNINTCSENSYNAEYHFEPINCYWNSKTNSCVAGIGCQ